jgi:hypothetical protein
LNVVGSATLAVTTITGGLVVTGGSLNVGTAASLGGSLNVVGSATLAVTTITGGLVVTGGSLNVGTAASLGGSLNVVGSATLAVTTITGGLVVTGGSLNVGTAASLGGSLNVVGASTLAVTTITGGLVVTGGSLNVGTAASIGGTLNVVGASTLAVTTITGGLVVTGGSLNVGTAASLGGTLNVVGASTLAVTTITGGLVVTGGSLNVGTAASLGGTLNVVGASSLAVTTITGGLVVTGGSLNVGTGTTLGGTLTVAGISRLSDTTITGSLSVTQNLYVGAYGDSTTKSIFFGGLAEDVDPWMTSIESRRYNVADQNELFLYKGNDGTTGGSAYLDRIRFKSGEIRFDIIGVGNDSTTKYSDNNIMTIAANGNVGIGTTTPGTTFQVVGASTLSVTTITGGLVVTGGSLNVGTAASLGGTLNVVGRSTLAVTTIVGGLVVTGGSLNVGAAASLGGTLNVVGSSTLAVTTITGGLVVTGGSLNVGAAASLGGTLNVVGASTLAVTTVTGGLNVTGGSRLVATSIAGTLGVAGILTVFSAATEQIQLVTGPSLSHIDFCSSGNGDYDTRLRSDGGTGTVGQGKMTVECANFVTPNTTVSGTLNVSGNLRITNAAGLTINSVGSATVGDKAFINLFEGPNLNWGAQLSNDSGNDVFRISMVDSGTPSDKIVIHRTYTTITNAAISMVGSLNVSGAITAEQSPLFKGNDICLWNTTRGGAITAAGGVALSHGTDSMLWINATDAFTAGVRIYNGPFQVDSLTNTQGILINQFESNGSAIPEISLVTNVIAPYEIAAKSEFGGDGLLRLRAGFNGGIGVATHVSFIDLCGYKGGGTAAGDRIIRFGTNCAERMRINVDGSVGIGTTTPTTRLQVSGGSVTAVSYFATSDLRIKTKITDLNCPSLDIIRKIKPREYTLIDGKCKDTVYGFVAQEVKDLIPKSVHIVTDFIPSIYENAFVDGKKITLINKTTIDISCCKLKIRNKNGGDTIVDVTRIYDNKTFSINGDISQSISCMDICGTNLDEYTKDGVTTYKRGSQVYTGEVKKGIFVYGIQVDDFHTLDKDTIWTVTLSATKELDTQLQLANSKIAEQDIRIAYLEQTVRRQQADIDAIKLRLG